MAVFDAILVPSDSAATNLTVNAATASAEQAFGPNVILAINANQDIMIRFGAAGSVATPSAADFRIPANSTLCFMTRKDSPSFKVFNNGSSAAGVWIQRFSQF